MALVGTLGLSSGRLSSQAHETRTQIAVQQGALAGAAALQDGGDAVGAATALLGQIGLTRADGALRARVEINRPPLTGPHAGDANAVEVVLLRPSPIGLAHVALATAMPTRIRAVAMLSAMAPACEPAALLTNCVASEANPWLPSPRLVE